MNARATDATDVALSWNGSTDNVGVAEYKIYRGGSLLAKTTSTSYVDGAVVPGSTYSYQVTALDAAVNESVPSATAIVTTPILDTTPPSAPSDLSATADDASHITLTWVASSDNLGVTAYRIYRDGSRVASTTSTSYVDNALAPATRYSYVVTALDAAGNESMSSNGVAATTPSVDVTPPSAPRISQRPSQAMGTGLE